MTSFSASGSVGITLLGANFIFLSRGKKREQEVEGSRRMLSLFKTKTQMPVFRSLAYCVASEERNHFLVLIAQNFPESSQSSCSVSITLNVAVKKIKKMGVVAFVCNASTPEAEAEVKNSPDYTKPCRK